MSPMHRGCEMECSLNVLTCLFLAQHIQPRTIKEQTSLCSELVNSVQFMNRNVEVPPVQRLCMSFLPVANLNASLLTTFLSWFPSGNLSHGFMASEQISSALAYRKGPHDPLLESFPGWLDQLPKAASCFSWSITVSAGNFSDRNASVYLSCCLQYHSERLLRHSMLS